MALSRPYLNLPPCLLLDIRPQEQVRQEENLPVWWNAVDYFDGVAAGADVVAFGLDLGGGVDVRHDHGIRMLFLPGPQLVSVDRGSERAARIQVRYENPFVRRHYRGGFGHEVHPAEDYDVCRCSGCGLGQPVQPPPPPKPNQNRQGEAGPGWQEEYQ